MPIEYITIKTRQQKSTPALEISESLIDGHSNEFYRRAKFNINDPCEKQGPTWKKLLTNNGVKLPLLHSEIAKGIFITKIY